VNTVATPCSIPCCLAPVGPSRLGFAHLLLSGRWALRAGIIVLTNDLLWWLPFALYLHDAWKARRLYA
jgi:hypothetical protein